jgi:hypothetical protein
MFSLFSSRRTVLRGWLTELTQRVRPRSYLKLIGAIQAHPCGGGFEYLHRDPASRRRRRKGKSQIWDSKIWSRVPRDSDPRKTTLARAISVYKRQTRPLIREGVPQKQYRNCQRVINISSWAPDGVRHQDLLIDWPSVAMWLWLWLWLWQRVWKEYEDQNGTAKRSDTERRIK